MDGSYRTLLVGTSSDPISVTVTNEALVLLDSLPGCSHQQTLADHRALLTTIAIGRVANGTGDNTHGIIVDADDILRTVDTPPTMRSGTPARY